MHNSGQEATIKGTDHANVLRKITSAHDKSTFCKLKGDSPFLETTDALGSLVIVGLVVSTSAVDTPVRPFLESALVLLDFFPIVC